MMRPDTSVAAVIWDFATCNIVDYDRDARSTVIKVLESIKNVVDVYGVDEIKIYFHHTEQQFNDLYWDNIITELQSETINDGIALIIGSSKYRNELRDAVRYRITELQRQADACSMLLVISGDSDLVHWISEYRPGNGQHGGNRIHVCPIYYGHAPVAMPSFHWDRRHGINGINVHTP